MKRKAIGFIDVSRDGVFADTVVVDNKSTRFHPRLVRGFSPWDTRDEVHLIDHPHDAERYGATRTIQMQLANAAKRITRFIRRVAYVRVRRPVLMLRARMRR